MPGCYLKLSLLFVNLGNMHIVQGFPASPFRNRPKYWQSSRLDASCRFNYRKQAFRFQAAGDNDRDNREFWLKEFTTNTGEVVEPYKILGVPREATNQEIKQSYRLLSRKYHPDARRYRSILPGSCNNEEEVRDQWERVKLSYEILSRPKMRRRYDRKEFLADPGAAVKRAAVDAAVKGAVNVSKGISTGLFKAGSFAFQQLTKKPERKFKKVGTEARVEMDNDKTVESLQTDQTDVVIIEPDRNVSDDVRILTETRKPAKSNKKLQTKAAKTRTQTKGRGFAKKGEETR